MSPLQVCPSPETLSDYLVGKLSDEEADSVTSHLKVCDTCVARLDEFDESLDSMVKKLKHPGTDDAFMREPECQQAVLASGPLAGEQVDSDLGQIRDYQLVRKLGEGGMGAVYEAIHTRLDQSVAIKVLPRERMESVEAVKRFHREMRAVGKLDHSHIVRAQDAGEVDGKHYLVMELVKGIDLSALVQRLGPLPVADACELIRQAAIGLQHVHEHGFIHRDIKPSNLMVTPEGNVKVLDLGLARLHEDARESKELTFEGQVMGTLDYMAPEQLGDSHTVGIRADIYGLGATLFKLLTGEAPYAGQEYNTPTKKLVAIATKPAPPIADFRSDISPALVAVVDRMVAKNPDDRYAEPSEVAHELEEFAGGSELSLLVAKAMPVTHPVVAEASVSTLPHVNSAVADTKSTRKLSNGHFSPGVPRVNSWFKRPAPTSVALCLLLFLSLLGVYYVRTNSGTLVVEVDDPQVVVKLKSHGIVVHDLKNNRQWTVWEPGDNKYPVGDYRLTVSDDSGLDIETKEFSLNRGENKIVSIRLRPAMMAADNRLPVDDDHGPATASDTAGDQIVVDENRGENAASRPRTSGEPMTTMALVSRPTKLNGVRSWSIETTRPRNQPFGTGNYSSQLGIRHSLAISPDDTLIATGMADGVVRIYEMMTGKLVHAWLGHEGGVRGVAWSSDQSLIAALGVDETVVIWENETGRVVDRKSVPGANSLAWSPQKNLLAIGGHQLEWWARDAQHPNVPEEIGRYIHALAWSSDGRTLAVAQAFVVHLFDTKLRKSVAEVAIPEVHSTVTTVTFSPKADSFLVGTRYTDLLLCHFSPGGEIELLEVFSREPGRSQFSEMRGLQTVKRSPWLDRKVGSACTMR